MKERGHKGAEKCRDLEGEDKLIRAWVKGSVMVGVGVEYKCGLEAPRVLRSCTSLPPAHARPRMWQGSSSWGTPALPVRYVQCLVSGFGTCEQEQKWTGWVSMTAASWGVFGTQYRHAYRAMNTSAWLSSGKPGCRRQA